MKHTQEKWKVNPYRTNMIEIDVQKEGMVGQHIASVTFYAGTKKETVKTRAHLIAASPTMYEYIGKQALNGDKEAQSILNQINA